MNIIILIDFHKNKFGGGTYSVFKFGEYLAKLGNSVEIFYVSNQDLYKKQFGVINLRIYKKPYISLKIKGSGRANKYLEKIYDKFSVEKIIKKNSKNIDYIMGIQTETAIKALKISEKYNIKLANFVFESPGWLVRKMGEEWKKQFESKKLKVAWEKFRKSLDKSDVVFPLSNLTKAEVEKWLNKVINKPIYPGFELHNRLFSGQKKNQIIYVGRLEKHKNVNEIIEALSRLENRPRFVICGEGTEKQKLKYKSRKFNVTCDFVGIIPDSLKWKLLSESKFLVFPSSFEGFGMPPMEALACGITSICSDIPILREVYKDKVEYFEEHNVKQLSEKIKFLLNNSNYCKKKGEEGKKYVIEKFSWKKSAQKIERTLEVNLNRKSN